MTWIEKIKEEALALLEQAPEIKSEVETVINDLEKLVTDFKSNPDTSALLTSVQALDAKVKATTAIAN